MSIQEYISIAEKSNQENVEKDNGEQDNNASEEEVVEEICKSDYDEFTDRYQKMDNDRKWKLATGKIVEDSLYKYSPHFK